MDGMEAGTAFEIAGLAGYPGLCFGEACLSEVFHQTETDRCVQKAAGQALLLFCTDDSGEDEEIVKTGETEWEGLF